VMSRIGGSKSGNRRAGGWSISGTMGASRWAAPDLRVGNQPDCSTWADACAGGVADAGP